MDENPNANGQDYTGRDPDTTTPKPIDLMSFWKVEVEPKPKPPNETNDAAKTAIDKQDETLNAIKKGERIALIIAGIVAFATFGQWITSYMNNTSTSDQTDRMILVAQRNERAATRFAESAKSINNGIKDAVGKLDAQAKGIENSRKTSEANSKAALDATIENFHQDQRAWIGLGDPSFTLNATDPLRITVNIKNVGKTPAQNVTGFLSFSEKAKNEVFSLADIAYPAAPSNGGTLYPSESTVVGRNLDAVVPGQEASIGELKSGDKTLYVFALVTYTDVFNKPHWTRFCVVVQKDLSSSHSCNGMYNDSDEDKGYKSK